MNRRTKMRSTPRIARAAVAAMMMACITISLFAPASAQQWADEESRIKAGFLYNFAKFVAWPAGNGPAGSRLQICIIGDSDVVSVLKREAEGKLIGDRQVAIQELTASSHFSNCQLLYISGREKKTEEILGQVKQLPVLTVGEDNKFLRRGGVINLVPEDGRLKFEVSLDAAARSGLSVSSKLLQVARTVVDHSRT